MHGLSRSNLSYSYLGQLCSMTRIQNHQELVCGLNLQTYFLSYPKLLERHCLHFRRGQHQQIIPWLCISHDLLTKPTSQIEIKLGSRTCLLHEVIYEPPYTCNQRSHKGHYARDYLQKKGVTRQMQEVREKV